VGFSVEKAQTQQLPVVAPRNANAAAPPMLVVEDSKRGWAEGLRALVAALYAGQTPQWDLSKLRPAGARLVTMGGRASGPDPLNDLFHFTVATFHRAAGRQLTPMECHDLMCKVGCSFCLFLTCARTHPRSCMRTASRVVCDARV
jgi:ribonucleoside-triphosphate reductase